MGIGDSVDLTEDQHAQLETLRAVLTDQLSSAELRAALDSEPGYHPDLHARLAGVLGLSGWTIPEEFGGLGKSLVEACAIHIELGRVLYPGPFLPSSVAAGALLATGHRKACEQWLPQLAAGTVAGTVAAADEAGHWRAGGVKADYGTGGWRLSGRRWYVVAAHAAGIIVAPAMTESGLGMFLAETGSAGLDISRQLDLDLTRRISIITFEAAPAVLLTRHADAALARAEREFLIATAAEAAGGIGWCLDASLAYVRGQGRGGSFEEVASFCVDLLADMENVSAAARYAAAATDVRAADAQKAARLAALQAGESYRRAAEANRDVLGRLPRPDVAVAHAAGQMHAENDRRARPGVRADLDVGVAHRQRMGVHDDARLGHQYQRPATHVHVDQQRVGHDDRLGEVQRHVAPRRPQLQPPRDDPAARAADRTSPLVDPDHVLGLRRGRAGSQVGGQRGQFPERPGRQGRLHPLIELISRQPAVPRRVAQHVQDSIPVCIRGP